jgi:asparagine synthase (glutamine-hydrolysing)
MCGICGQYNFMHKEAVVEETIAAMTRTLVHRGPDDEGRFVSGPVGLGFRRLSIIDLETGRQPMSDADGKIQVVFNGEIYNFPELRRELESRGYVFRTRSDTEVIVHGYREWGAEVLGRLDGMFGLAIWDVAHRRLILARDPMGIKLVYYRVDGGSVLFASEMKAILAALPGPPDVDVASLNLFLRYRYTPSPRTLHAGIRKLAPGTMALFDEGRWSVARWYAPDTRMDRAPGSDAEAAAELLERYRRALRRHLLADVPVGLLLSGGVDSGLLLGLMSERGASWPTFTVGYGKSAYEDDELAEGRETARIFGASHVAVEVTPDAFERALPEIVSHLEEPIAASSIVPMYFVCQRARGDVKVALMGQGPDELFAGYTRHLGVHYGGYWRSVPRWLRTPIEVGIDRLPRNEALKRGVRSLATEDRMERYRNVFSILPGDSVNALFRDGILPDHAHSNVSACWDELAPMLDGTDELGGFQTLELRSSLPDELLMYADKLSMAHGLEVRVPYLDREVVEYVTRLPSRFKVRHGRRKWLHREVCRRFLPPRIVGRKKRGFAVDAVDRWFHASLSGRMSGYLLDQSSLMFTYLRPEAVKRLVESHRSGRHDHHKILFSLVVFEEWLRSGQSRRHKAAA